MSLIGNDYVKYCGKAMCITCRSSWGEPEVYAKKYIDHTISLSEPINHVLLNPSPTNNKKSKPNKPPAKKNKNSIAVKNLTILSTNTRSRRSKRVTKTK